MINITKQNETYNISETAENGWVMNGTASYNTDGTCNINFSVNKSGGIN